MTKQKAKRAKDITISDYSEDDKMIYAFMAGKWKPIRNWTGGSFSSVDEYFKTEAACQKWCDLENKRSKASVLYEKWFAVPRFTDVFYGRKFRYQSWDILMEVVVKWEKLCTDKKSKINNDGKNLDDPRGWKAWSYRYDVLSSDKAVVYKKLVANIRWYNTTKRRKL